MKLKELKKTVNVSWSPAEHYPVLLAAGSAAQQVDASFSSTSMLELYSLNLDDPGLDLKVEASIQAQHKFQKLVWSGAGVIVGGCDSGLLQFYSTEKLLQNAADPLLGSVTKHTGQINALDINPYQKNLLASGASESEIFIWDLNNTSQPMAPGGRSQPHQPVQAVAWNQQVQHILGSTFATRCVVWDLRKNEPIMKLTDSVHGTRWRALTWHPSVATQLCVASEDDAAPVLQLWDLRLAAAPLATLSGHHKGVTSAAWSARDPRLLLSGARDGRLLCWDPSAGHPGGEIVSEVYSSQQWVLDVSWSPRAPGLLASAGSEQGLAVHTLLGGSAPHISTQAQSNIMESFGGACSLGSLPAVADPPRAAPAQPVRPPAWMRRRAPATLAFGGKLVTVEKCPEEPGEPRKVYISQVVTEPDLVERAAELDNLLNDSLSSDPTAIERLAEYCGARGAAARAQHERCLWYLLRASFRDCFREELRELLGFKDDDILSRFKNATIGDTPTQNALLSREESTETEAELSTDTSTDLSEAHTLIERKLTDREDSPQPTNIMIPNGDDPTSLICRALVTGNLEAAVELCLESKMVADALIIASLSSPDLLLKVQRYHLSLNASSPVALLTRGLLTDAWERVVSGVAPAAWRVCLAALAPRPAPCELLGDKLSSEPAVGVDGATLCYVCAGAVDRAVSRLVQAGGARGERGARGARGEGGAGEGETDVDWLATLALVLRRSAQVRGREPQPGGPLESVLIRFAQRLADAGALEAALRSLQGVADTTLADRLMCALYGTPQTQQAPQSQTHAASRAHTHTRAQRDTHAYSAAPAPAPTACDTSRAAQPARPPSVTSQPGGITGRSKYKVDPSVQSAPLYNQYSFNNPAPPYAGFNSPPPEQYNPIPNTFTPITQQPYQSNPLAPNPLNPVPSMLNPVPNTLNPMQNQFNSVPSQFNPVPNQLNPAQNQLNPVPNQLNPVQNQPALNGSYYQNEPLPRSVAPGWNDPPMMTAKPKPKQEVQAQAPITHPLFGVEPPQHVPLPGQLPAQVPGQAPNQGYPGQSYPGQNYPAQSYPGQEQYQGYPAQLAQAAYPQKPATPPPAPKPPLPPAHAPLQAVLDDLRLQCAARANSPQMKRKLEDIERRLETLYDLLREYKLSEGALCSLHACAQALSPAGAGARAALGLTATLASGADFAAVASFLPALKALIQLASQLQVCAQ